MPLLGAAFFDRTALKVAYDLIGCRLNWKGGDQAQSRIITEIMLVRANSVETAANSICRQELDQWVIHGSCKSNGVWMRFGDFGNSQGNSSRSSSLQGSLASHPAQLRLKLVVNESRSRKNRIR
jgi:hypothetical protein